MACLLAEISSTLVLTLMSSFLFIDVTLYLYSSVVSVILFTHSSKELQLYILNSSTKVYEGKGVLEKAETDFIMEQKEGLLTGK